MMSRTKPIFAPYRPETGPGRMALAEAKSTNIPLFEPPTGPSPERQPVQCRERLSGLLRYYHQEAA
jgi:hypothetical protein